MSDAVSGYQEALSALGVSKRWHQTGSDLLFAAVVAAVEQADAGEILARAETLRDRLPARHQLHYITQTVAAVSVGNRLDLDAFVAVAEEAAEELRPAARSARLRLIAGAVIASAGDGAARLRAARVVDLHTRWNRRHRLLTNALDLSLAAVVDAAGVDPVPALARAETAWDRLSAVGYQREWDLARILALDEPALTVDRFLSVAKAMRGRRRKPLADRRNRLAIAALADRPPAELAKLLPERSTAMRVGRFKPDKTTAVALAGLLTLGASVPSTHRLRAAFHGLVLREHYVTSYREATSD